MHRTNIYLSGAEQAGLDALAAAEGCSRSEVIRAVIDRELNLGADSTLDEVLGDMAGELAQRARTLSATDPDLCIE